MQDKAVREVAAAVELASAKGWKSLRLDGSEEIRLSVAIDAAKRSIDVDRIANEVLAKARSIAGALKSKQGWKR